MRSCNEATNFDDSFHLRWTELELKLRVVQMSLDELQIRSRFFSCTVIRPTLVSERRPERMKKCIFRHRPRKYGTFSQKLKFLKCILHCFPQQHKTYEKEFSFFLRFFFLRQFIVLNFFPTWNIKVVLNYLSSSPSALLRCTTWLPRERSAELHKSDTKNNYMLSQRLHLQSASRSSWSFAARCACLAVKEFHVSVSICTRREKKLCWKGISANLLMHFSFKCLFIISFRFKVSRINNFMK